jgi:penicillin-binding protein 1A
MGTLAYGAGYGTKLMVRDEKGVTYRIPAGGKTGTSQNWSDAWAVGYTPYYTIAIWFGFDKGGNSLGMNVSGATLAGPIWGNLMHEYNQGLPRRDFPRPPGVVDGTVCRASGLLPTSKCPSVISLTFLAGTVPTEQCDEHGGSTSSTDWLDTLYGMPSIPEEFRHLFEGTGANSGTDSFLNSLFPNIEDPEMPGNYDPFWD